LKCYFTTAPACIVDNGERVVIIVFRELLNVQLPNEEIHDAGEVRLKLGEDIDGTVSEKGVGGLTNIVVEVLCNISFGPVN
jgi:hypothetical protein